MSSPLSRFSARLGLQLPLVESLAKCNWPLRPTQSYCMPLAAPASSATNIPWTTPATDLAAYPVSASRQMQTQSRPCCAAATAAAFEAVPENDARDTIAALSSGPGRSGVAVIRLSGPRAGAGSYLSYILINRIATRFSCQKARYVLQTSCNYGCTPCGLARSKQDPIKQGHGAPPLL